MLYNFTHVQGDLILCMFLLDRTDGIECFFFLDVAEKQPPLYKILPAYVSFVEITPILYACIRQQVREKRTPFEGWSLRKLVFINTKYNSIKWGFYLAVQFYFKTFMYV